MRPYGARGLVQAMEDLGRDVIYTDCRRAPVRRTNFECSGTMSNAALADAIDAYADLIFTSVRNCGHGPWNVWYDHPLLADWLFSKNRVDPETIEILAPANGRVWNGITPITWNATGAATDTIEVWISLENNKNREQVGRATLGEASYALNTANYSDAAVVRLRLLAFNEAGRIYGRQTSGLFSIDNEYNGVPFLLIDDESLRFDPRVADESVNLSILAADPEGNPLPANVYYPELFT